LDFTYFTLRRHTSNTSGRQTTFCTLSLENNSGKLLTVEQSAAIAEF